MFFVYRHITIYKGFNFICNETTPTSLKFHQKIFSNRCSKCITATSSTIIYLQMKTILIIIGLLLFIPRHIMRGESCHRLHRLSVRPSVRDKESFPERNFETICNIFMKLDYIGKWCLLLLWLFSIFFLLICIINSI